MTDLQILTQLLNGCHLESKELEQAENLIIQLNTALINRK